MIDFQNSLCVHLKHRKPEIVTSDHSLQDKASTYSSTVPRLDLLIGFHLRLLKVWLVFYLDNKFLFKSTLKGCDYWLRDRIHWLTCITIQRVVSNRFDYFNHLSIVMNYIQFATDQRLLQDGLELVSIFFKIETIRLSKIRY